LKKQKKFETRQEKRMGKSVHTSGSDPEGEGNKESAACRTKRKTNSGRERPDNIQRKNCQETCILKSELRCFYTNANSLIKKTDELRKRMLNKDYDIISIVETWAHDGIGDAELAINVFQLYLVDRKGHRSGGVIIYINDKFNSVEEKCINMELFEDCVWCTV